MAQTNTTQGIIAYDNLIADSVDVVQLPITIATNQTIVRGDLLELVVAETFTTDVTNGTPDTATTSVARTIATSYVKPSAVANIKNEYAIAAEDVTTTDTTATIIAFKFGVFNANKINYGGSSTADQNTPILNAKGLFVKYAQTNSYT